jgi:hypothetical protein
VFFDLPLDFERINKAPLPVRKVRMDSEKVFRLADRNGVDDRFGERVASVISVDEQVG